MVTEKKTWFGQGQALCNSQSVHEVRHDRCEVSVAMGQPPPEAEEGLLLIVDHNNNSNHKFLCLTQTSSLK